MLLFEFCIFDLPDVPRLFFDFAELITYIECIEHKYHPNKQKKLHIVLTYQITYIHKKNIIYFEAKMHL